MPDRPMTDLDTASVRDLMEELRKRFDALVFVGFKRRGEGQKDHLFSLWQGSQTICDGLLVAMKRTLDHADRVEGRETR